MKRVAAWVGGLAAILLAVAVAGWLYAPHWHPSEAKWPIQGIDVSHHQGEIAWAELPRQGVDFAYLKATEGGDHRDRLFAANLTAAHAAGIPVGAYHFFTLCRPGAEQAENFNAALGAGPTDLPPAVDLEFGGNCAARPARDVLRRELAAFLAAIERPGGPRAILYLTPEFERDYRVSEAIDRPLWLRSLVVEARFGGRRWTIWQASSFRHLRGIEGRVDWNVMRR